MLDKFQRKDTIEFMKCIWFLAAAVALFSTEQFTIERADSTQVTAYADKPNQESFPIVFVIAGSQKETTLRLYEAVQKDLTARGFCPVALEKRGVSSHSIDDAEFIQHLSIQERLGDHLLFYKKLKELLPGWNGKTAIVGQGDGGRIGVELATHLTSIEAIALIASGGLWPPMEEALYSFRSEMADDGFSPQYIHGFLVQARREFAQALETPKTDRKAFGYTYKYWESLLKTQFAKNLSTLKCPIYSIHGEKDNRVPIESVEQLAGYLEDRMILIRKENAGREIAQDLETYKEAISWISLECF